jgi:predicted TIM-barrel fold metal-dependent hydrolase
MKPIIDIHAHTFRGRDIPLRGYLLSRKYDEWYIRLLGPILFRVIADCVRRAPAEKKGLLCGLVLELLYGYMGQGYRRWADILAIQEVAEIAEKLIETYDKDGIDLYVPLMVDYEYWFRNSKEPHISKQIDDTYRDIVLRFQGKIHPFAPFDPARELAFRHQMPGPDGSLEKYSSLDMAKEAVRNKGFIGVKVYNTLGYRPLGNAAVDKKRRRIFRKNKMTQYERFTGEEFDQVLSDLYQFCTDEQVPITAHCVSNGVEAYWRASFDFGRPEYWQTVLDAYPDLHVNLGHFGWDHPEGYYPRDLLKFIKQSIRKVVQSVRGQTYTAMAAPEYPVGKETWTREICEMMAKSRHLYADVSHHGVTKDADIPKYKTAFRGMCNDFPGMIQQKTLFGIDWHVITRADNYEQFKDRYVGVLGDEGIFTDEQIEDFLGGNALRFLGLLPLGTDPGVGWTKNRERLQRFYDDNNINAPDWFTATG